MHRRTTARTFVLATICVGLGLSGSKWANADEKATDRVFVGYLYGQPRKINFSLYTHLCHAFVTADAEGMLNKGRSIPSRELTAEAHKAGVKVLVSLGGWGWDKQFASMVLKPEAEERYIKAVLALVDEYDYDGIDFDWEYPDTRQEVAGFERISRRFRKELDAIGARKGRSMALTMAASSNAGTLKWLDPKFLVETMDWVNVMTYDFAGDWTDFAGHNSPLFDSSKHPQGKSRSTEASLKYLLEERGLPAHKLALGIPLYGRGFAVKEPYQSTKGVPKTRIPNGDYRNLHRLKDEQGWTRQWDDQTKTPWLMAPDHSMVFGYDDAESVRLKAEWANQHGLRGVFFWQIDGDRLSDGTNPLQEAARKAWEAGARKGRD